MCRPGKDAAPSPSESPITARTFDHHDVRLRRVFHGTSLVAILVATLAGEWVGAAAREVPSAPPDSGGARRSPAERLAMALAGTGLENVRVSADSAAMPRVAYENRRFRHSVDALGEVHRLTGGGTLAFERRLALTAAAITFDEADAARPFHVRYPSDRGFPSPPAGKPLSPTARSVDVEVGPLLTYEIGHIFDPLQLRIDLAPVLRYNPWPGALTTLGLVIPLRNDFTPTDLNPDINRLRPGPLRLDQFAFLPGVALISGSVGYFGDNRYGLSLGAARPIAGGRLLLDAQLDDSGFLAFTEEGTLYSRLDQWGGFVGLTWRPPIGDVAVRARGARFLYGDRGGDLEVRRAMGDFEVGGFVTRSAGVSLYGVRLDLPVPPMTRRTGSPVRLQPVARFPLDFRSTSEPVGTFLSGVASREGFLRQLNEPGMADNIDRYRRHRGGSGRAREGEDPNWVSVAGMTGFVNTPWAGVLPDRGLEVGYRYVPRRWAWDRRGLNANEVYYATLGFLPHLEVSMRWTRIPGYHSFEELVPDSRLTDMDRMASARLELLPPRARRPGLAVGIEDAQGTRRFHSTYAVAGLPLAILHVHSRATMGYGFRVFEASRHVLDGAFGALEITPWRRLVAQVEHDSEKWNAALGIAPGLGFRLRAAWLHLESMSLGVGFYHRL